MKKNLPLLKMHLQHFSENKDNKELETLQKSFNDSWKELKGLLDNQADQIRAFGTTNDTTATSIKSVEEKIEQYEKELKGITDKQTDLETKIKRAGFMGDGSQNKEIKTAGQLFSESESYAHMIKNNSKRSENVDVKSFFTKDLDSTDPNGGLLATTTRIPEIFAPNDRRLTLRQLMNAQATGSNAIEFISETGFTNNAGVVAEKIAKPESDITFDIETATIKTIAHWIPVTNQILQDATQLRNYVDNRLIYGLQVAEENQILYGTGTGEDLQGIMTHDRIQNAGGVVGADTMIDHIRRSITLSTLAGYPTTGIVVHPRDMESIELMKADNGQYIWINVNNGGEPRLFRVPVVESLAMVEGEFLMGAFGLGGQIWDRMQANVRVSESHADFFTRNMQAILAEERIGMTLYRPESFVRGLFSAVV